MTAAPDFVDLFAHLRAQAAATPSRTALTFLPAGPQGRRLELTYGDMVARSLAAAAAFARLAAGTRVLLLLPPGPDFAAAFLGCLAAGVIAVPLPLPVDEGSRRRMARVALDCAPSLIVSVRAVRELAPEVAGCEWLLADEGWPAGAPEVPRAREPATLAFLQYTSGSTASPRGVMISHGSLMANEAAIQRSFGVTAASTIVSWLPLHHDMGLIGGLLQPLYAGARGVLLDAATFVRRPASWLEAISSERADISGGPNFAYDLCVQKITAAERARLDLSHWRVAFNGAAPVFPRTLRAFSKTFRDAGFRPSAHVPCYGLAEATLLVSAAPGGSSMTFSAEALEAGVARLDPAGARELPAYPLPEHTTMCVVAPGGREPVGEGRVGEIIVAGESNGSGYWGDADQSTFGLALAGDPARAWVRTGDLGFILGGHFFIQGRCKDLIIHRGRNLHPDDLEADLAGCDQAARPGGAAVFGLSDDGDEAVIVCQEVREGTPAVRYPEIAQRLRAALAQGHGVTPRTVALLAPRTLPRTTSGKLERHQLARRFAGDNLPSLYRHDLPAQARRSLSERLRGAGPDALTRALCEHLQEALDLPAVPTGRESLAALGASSLAATQLQYQLEEALGIVASPTLALRAASVAELAAAALEPRSQRERLVPAGAYELNAAQRALWFLQRAQPGSAAYNITRALRITGALDVARLEDALSQVVARHASLRLAVISAGGEPRAEVRPLPRARLETIDARAWTEVALGEWHRARSTMPFDLERDPPLRAALLRRADDWLLALTVHHLACDGESLAILAGELAAVYRGAPLADDDDVSPGAWERARLAERGDELVAWWREALAGELPRLSLPGAGRGNGGMRAATVFAASAETTARLAQRARELGVTLHNVLFATWQLLLHRLTGQRDLLVGVPASGRVQGRLASVVGNLVNVLPIRSSFASGCAFADFARQTQASLLDALDHQELPLSHITRAVNPERERAGSSIFQAMFACYGATSEAAAVVMGDPEAELPLGGAWLRGHALPDYTVQSELCLDVYLHRERIAFELQADAEKVSGEQVEQLRATFTVLLEAVAAEPGRKLGRLPLLDGAEVARLVALSTGPQRARPLHYLRSFEEMARRFPERVAVDDGQRRLSYAELDERSNQAAAGLRALGVGVDGNVVVSAARSVDYLVALLGIHKADGCYVPISPAEAPQRAAAMIAAVHPVACIADGLGRPVLAGAPEGIVDLAELTGERSAHRPARLVPGWGSAYIIHTSGSTGVPKPVVSTHAGLTNHIWQMIEYFDLGAGDCVGQTGPVSFDVSVWQLLTPLVIGGRVRIVPEPMSVSARPLHEAMLEGGITLLELVPSAVVGLLDAGVARSPGALRIMIATGEALNSDVPRRWARELPALPLYNAYGPCECTDDVSIGLSAWGAGLPTSVSIGRPLANTSMFVLDDDLQPAPVGVTGWLCVGGAGVGRGYLGNPRQTARAFMPDPWSATPGARLYRTGDLARMTAGGDVEFLGRADTQIKIRGVRIEPGEVEAALCECPGIAEAAVKVERGPAGAFLVAFVVLRDGAGEELGPQDEARLRSSLAERLPRHMIPSVLVRVGRLPRSANGKTDYGALRYTPRAAPAQDDSTQHDALAVTVRSIWAAHLGRQQLGWHESFFQLGGHSMLALSMVDEVGRATGLEISVDTVFSFPQLREFVGAVRRAPSRRPAAARVDDGRAQVPASTAQQRFWFLEEMDPGHPTFNMPGVVRMRGALDDAALESALRETLGRHRLLVARFSDEGGALTWTPGAAADGVLRRLDLRGAVVELGEEVFDRLATTEAAAPFDLKREVPFRALLARLGADDWRLLVCIHHIACDGWSLGVFLRDLAGAYNRRARGLPPPVENGYGFDDYCRDERTHRNGYDPAPDWRGLLGGAVRTWPRNTPAHKAGSAVCSFLLDGEIAAGLEALAGRTGATPFMLFISAVGALMHSGSADRETVVLGTLVAQRDRREWRDLVGPLLNVSVLAVALSLGDRVTASLERARAAALRAQRARHVPYQELVGMLGAPVAADGSPFEVLLILQPEPEAWAELDGLTTDLVELETGVSPYPMVVDVEPGAERNRVTLRSDRCPAGELERLAARLASVLRSMADGADPTLEDVLRGES